MVNKLIKLKSMKSKVLISVVTPVYKAELMVDELVLRLVNELKKITENYEVILVEDCSPDNSWKRILENSETNTNIKGIKLSRNFGQHFAIFAGLENAIGEWIIVMDCDLQDRPEEINELYKKAQQGYDVVLASRKSRQDSFIKTYISKFFYFFLSYLTETKQDSTIANFGIYNRKVIDAILTMKESVKFFPAMVKWVGFEQTILIVQHDERMSGKSSYNFKKLLKLGLDITLTFSDKPLRLTVKFGLFISFLSMLFGFYNLYKYCNGEILVSGWTSLVISIWFLSGIIIFVSGITGLYIGKIFENVKGRPVYIADEKINF